MHPHMTCCPMLLIICSVWSSFCKGRVQKPESRKNPINAFPILCDANLTKADTYIHSDIYSNIWKSPCVDNRPTRGWSGLHWNACPLAHLWTLAYFRWQTPACREGCWSVHLHVRWMVIVLPADLLDGQHICCMLTIGGWVDSRMSSRQGGLVADRWNAPPPSTNMAPPQNWPCQGPSTLPPSYMDKYIWQFGQIHFTIWKNTFDNLDKYILQFGQIHFTIWTNTFCDLHWHS